MKAERPYRAPLIGALLAGVVLGLVCPASVVPVGYYYFIGWILTLL